MKKILSVSGMREAEKVALDNGATVISLMSRAAQAVYENVNWKAPVAIVCGSGNNAGDGYALANILHDHQIECKIFLLAEKFTEAGRHYYDLAMKHGIPSEIVKDNENFAKFATIVDCIFGTGFSGEVHGKAKEVIQKINSAKAFVVSVDINSGLDANTGLAAEAVRSDLTVSIGSFKPGHFLNMAKDYIRKAINCDIGITATDENVCLFEEEDVKAVLKKRKNFSNKGDFGYISLICGSKMYSGASKLANLAACAMASGAGVVKLAVPNSIADSVSPYLLESTLFPLSDKGGSIKFDKKEMEQLAGSTDAIAVGMGLGQSDEVAKAVKFLLTNFSGVLILDADALNVVSKIGTDVLKNKSCKLILTPHAKEFSRLTGKSVVEVLSGSMELASQFAKAHDCIVLLKGSTTVVTDGTQTYLVSRGCPGMATAGSGDVLSGILAAICGYSSENLLLSTATASLINGMAGELAEQKFGDISMVSSDTVAEIKGAIKNLSSK